MSVGRLWGSLAEADTGLLRYLDLQLSSGPRHVLVPIGHARLREHDGVPAARLRAALLEDLEAVPEYDPEQHDMDDEYEHQLLELHGRAYHGEQYYAHPAFNHTGLYAGPHPILRTGQLGTGETLRPLSELPGHRVARGEPDIRGWPLTGFAEALLGQISDLIVDPEEEKVRYLVVATAGQRLQVGARRLRAAAPGRKITTAPGRQVLVPVGFLSIDRGARLVRATSLFTDDVAALPGYAGGSVDRATEEAVRAALLAQLRGHRRYLLPDYDPRALAEG